MNGATALHTRARCDECARPATREGTGGIVLCDGCAMGLPRPANDDVIAAALNSPRICTRCQIRPAMLRVDETRALCSECWRQLDARLLDDIDSDSSFPVASSPGEAAAIGTPPPASAVAAAVNSQVPLGWSPSDRQTVADAPTHGLEFSATVANFDPEYDRLVSALEVEMGWRAPSDSAKNAATSASFAASDSAENFKSSPVASN